jgi:lactate dehydrogenase-like 2-hydroxyacid dehydrogenase
MRMLPAVLLTLALTLAPAATPAAAPETIAVIGTGRVGSALGPRLADLGHPVIYGSRDP